MKKMAKVHPFLVHVLLSIVLYHYETNVCFNHQILASNKKNIRKKLLGTFLHTNSNKSKNDVLHISLTLFDCSSSWKIPTGFLVVSLKCYFLRWRNYEKLHLLPKFEKIKTLPLLLIRNICNCLSSLCKKLYIVLKFKISYKKYLKEICRVKEYDSSEVRYIFCIKEHRINQ